MVSNSVSVSQLENLKPETKNETVVILRLF